MENTELVILPTDEDAVAAENVQSLYQQHMVHLQKLMFDGDPTEALAQMDTGEHRLCSASWTYDDVGYSCRTCGLDPSRAICVPCFQNGNHTGHDCSLVLACDSYCDCGDVTAWKHDGFCSKHDGTRDIKPLEDKLANSMRPVLVELFKCWKNKLESNKYVNELTAAIVEMLLLLCNIESLQSFIAMNIMSSAGLIEILIKSEMLLKKDIVKELLHLLMKLIMVDGSFKYVFAREFLNYYPSVVKESIKKGNDRRLMPMLYNFSRALFVDPSITRRLAEEENVLGILFTCVEDLFVASAGDNGRLQSTMWEDFGEITMHIFEDIEVVIKNVTVPLRDLSRTWLRILSFVQEMHPIKRQVGTHAEEETDNMEVPRSMSYHISNINSLFVGGAFDICCSTLSYECVKAIDICLGFYNPASGKLTDPIESQSRMHLLASSNLRLLSLSEWPNIACEVGLDEISIHLPLHRFFSVVLQNVLRKCQLSRSDVFGHLLKGCYTNGFSAFLMEHPLRARVFSAQFGAGMWGKNDDIARIYFDWYLNPHWLEGLESDLFLLQFCAAFAPADLYVKRILERFELSEYLSLHLEKSSEYEPDLVREMLMLLVQIVKERQFCGLTTSQILKREIIYKLAVEDMTRNKLIESIPKHYSQSDNFEKNLDMVAIYSGPSDWKEGMYSLRPSCWTELDFYSPRCNMRNSQVARDRYRRFCKASPVCAQLPRWTNISTPLEGVARIATCKPVTEIIRAVLFYAAYADKSTDPRASDEIVIIALHLLSVSLDICSQQRELGEELLGFAGEEITEEFTNGAAGHSLLSLLVMLMRMYMEENQENCGNRDLLSLIESLVEKFAHIDSGCITKLHQLVPELVSHDVKGLKLASENGTRKAKARQRQADMMAKIKADQSNYLSSIESTEVGSGSDTEESSPVVCSLCYDSTLSDPICFLILLQKSKFLGCMNKCRPSWEKEEVILKELVLMSESRLVDRSGMEPSASGSSTRNIEIMEPSASGSSTRNIEIMEPSASGSPTRNIEIPCTANEEHCTTFDSFEKDIYANFWKEMQTNNKKVAAEGFNQDDTHSYNSTSCYDEFCPVDCDGVYISSCGHGVHQKCLDLYSSLNGRQPLSAEVEFLCPICHKLANSVLPAFPGDFHKQSFEMSEKKISLRLLEAVFLLRFIAKNNDIVKAPSLTRNTEIVSQLEYVTRLSSKIYSSRNDGLSPSVILWDSLRYSIMSMEVASRCGRKHTSPSHNLNTLNREVDSPNGFVLSLLVKVVKTLKSKNSNDVLQRSRGLKLFSESICSGVSLLFPSGTSSRGGETLCPDIQCWNWASDPVLIRDPFSTLMWVIFCLPSPFMLCVDTFMFLVHLFYVVGVAQAVAHCVHGQIKMDNCEYHLVNIMHKIMGESGFAWQYASSKYVDPSSSIVEIIRKTSFPYLRRCALLWKLLSSTVAVPYSGNDLVQQSLVTLDSDSDSDSELKGVLELENMFKIPAVDTILKDEMLQSSVLKWIHHFQWSYKARNLQCIFYSSMAVPFLLMHLPYRYEDLFLRYRMQSCPICKERLSEPALCLLCGRLCNWENCCGKSNCRDHAMTCGAGIGVFLLIKSTETFLQRSARTTFWPSLYLDAFGEADVYMMRRVQLFLNEERYAALAYMVSSHGVDRSCSVLSQPT